MPSGSKVARCVRHVMDDGKSKVPAIKICQTSTGDSYRTGKKSKNENTMHNIYERTITLVKESVRTSILEKDIRTASKIIGKVTTGTARMGMEGLLEVLGKALGHQGRKHGSLQRGS